MKAEGLSLGGDKNKNVCIAKSSGMPTDDEFFIEGHRMSIRCLAVTSDDRYLVSGSGDSTLRIWNLETKTQIAVLRGHRMAINSIVISADECHIISGSLDTTIRIWSFSTFTQESVLQAHKGSVTSIALLPINNCFVSASHDGTIRVWNIITRDQECFFIEKSEIYAIATAGLERPIIISSLNTKTLTIWDLTSKKAIKWFDGHKETALSLAVSSSNAFFVSGGYDKTLRLWYFNTNKNIVLGVHSSAIYAVAITIDESRAISASSDYTVKVWSVREKKVLAVIKEMKEEFYALSLMSNQRFFVAGGELKRLKIWGLEEFKIQDELNGHNDSISCVCRVDGIIVSVSRDKTIRVWNKADAKQLAVLDMFDSKAYSVTVTRKYVVCGTQKNTFIVWKAVGIRDNINFH